MTCLVFEYYTKRECWQHSTQSSILNSYSFTSPGCYANKVQLINIICEYLVKKVAERITLKRLIVSRCTTGSSCRVLIQTVDLRATHEEADDNMIQQCVSAVKEGAKCVKLICDDTENVLLVHFTMYWIFDRQY